MINDYSRNKNRKRIYLLRKINNNLSASAVMKEI